jgi:hypothetical protein
MNEPEILEEPVLAPSVRATIVGQLPPNWTEQEINHFIATYYGKLPQETSNAEAVAEMEEAVEEVVGTSALPLSTASRKGHTLDTYVILDGRSVPLRAIFDAGMLVPIRSIIREGSRRFPRQAVLYEARVIDRNLSFTITEETYKVLSATYPNVSPHDEPLPAEAVKAIQSKVTVIDADKMERTFTR